MAQPLSDEPRDLLLDGDNDLVITTDLQFSRGIAAVAQSCRIALQMFAGEWFLDLDAGIRYWEDILAQKPHIAVAAAKVEFRRELLAVSGVLRVLKLDALYNTDTRALNVTWQVLTSLGETPVDTIALSIGGS